MTDLGPETRLAPPNRSEPIEMASVDELRALVPAERSAHLIKAHVGVSVTVQAPGTIERSQAKPRAPSTSGRKTEGRKTSHDNCRR